MKKRKKGITAGLLCLLFFSAVVVNAETLAFTDKLGRTVNVPVPVKRAVFFETFDLVAHLDIWDSIVGISRFAYDNDLVLAVKPDIQETIPTAGSALDLNIEALLRLRPDLVITWTYTPAVVPFMEEKGLRVFTIRLETVPEVYEVMRLLGKLFAKERQMEASIDRMKKFFNLVEERVAGIPDHERKKVLWLGRKPDTVAGNIGLPNDMFSLMRGINVAASLGHENAEVSIERIVSWNPEVVFIWGGARFEAKDILQSSQWRHVKAVRGGQVYKAPHWSRWSPRLAPVALWMAMRTYPERFRDVNLEQMTDDFFMELYGTSYRRMKQFVD